MRVPLFVDLTGRRVLVVGAGPVGARRALALAESGAEVVVVAPSAPSGLGLVEVQRRPFRDDDVEGAWLVLACTDSAEVNAAVVAAAEARGIWCGRADAADSSSVWFPAHAQVEDVQVAVVAGGDPARAAALRDRAALALHAGEWSAPRVRARAGRVVLVGGGPGAPGLLTMAGYRALLDADVVVVDRLAPTDLVALLPEEVEVVDVGKSPRGSAPTQDTINTLLVERAKRGQSVVRLKGGDPFVLGRGSEEVDACVDAGIAVEVIPGVTSATAAATIAGVPLTRRGTAQEFTVASGHVPPGDERSTVDWARLAAGRGTLVLLMAVANLAEITAALLAGGRDAATPVVVVEDASLPTQRVLRGELSELPVIAARERVRPPAVVVIGDVVSDRPGVAAERP